MEMSSTSSPSAHILRRRKKRGTPTAATTTTNTAPGSSLSALNRSSIRVVELHRGLSGYGFTISGQKPCLLRCIVEASPAGGAGLRPGNCLVGVNGQDVSHLAHDDVVRLIGSCSGLLRLHVADSYFSESSDDESFQMHQPRPKYPHRPRALSKGALAKKHPSQLPLSECSSSNNDNGNKLKKSGRTPGTSGTSRLNESHHHHPQQQQHRLALKPSDLSSLHNSSNNSTGTYHSSSMNSVEIVRVFAHLDDEIGISIGGGGSASHNSTSSNSSNKSVPSIDFNPNSTIITNSNNNNNNNINNNNCSNTSDRFNTQSSSGSSGGVVRTHNLVRQSSSPSVRSNSSLGIDCPESSLSSSSSSAATTAASTYQAVVGYIGSVELPEIEEKKRLQALSACVRRLRQEKRVRSIVLLRIQSNGVSLFSSSQNVQNGSSPLAFYSSSIIAFCGAYSDDRRFFGLVTCTGHTSKSCSCHVFMVEPKLLSHSEHMRRARTFGIVCTSLPVPKNGQVLGLQECSEFPATADPILSSILRLHRPMNDEDNSDPLVHHHLQQQQQRQNTLQQQQQQQQQQQRSPSEASNRLESTNSSNSDSGIGFRDDSDRTSARIYDIVEPELSLPMQDFRNFRRSPVPRKRFPISNRKGGNNNNHHHLSPQYQQPQQSTSSSVSSGNSNGNSCLPSTSKHIVNSMGLASGSGPSQRMTRDTVHSLTSSRVSNPSCFFSDELTGSHDFETDPNSLREILGIVGDSESNHNNNNKSSGTGASSSMDINNIKLSNRIVKNSCPSSRERLATPPSNSLNPKPKPKPKPNSITNSKMTSSSTTTTSSSSSSTSRQPPPQPRHIEVSVLVTPPRGMREKKRVSMEHMTPLSPTMTSTSTSNTSANSNSNDNNNNNNSSSISSASGNSHSSPLPHRVALSRNGTRSLDNLCSPEILVQNSFESKGNIGSSTPALNQESGKVESGGDDFWEFKKPQPPPKPKMEVNRMDKWAECIEKLLTDYQGFQLFKEFLEHEFSAENIHFYTDCQHFKERYAELTQSQRISMASTIFQRFLQNGATDPVNVDFQARCQVEKALRLSQPTIDMFDLPLGQVYNLLKFDCYPRFLRSDMFRDFANGMQVTNSTGDPSDSDQDSVKSHKQDGRRRSLLPWNIKNRSKNKHRSNKNNNDGEFLNADLSFIQRTSMNQIDASDDQDDDSFRRKSYKLCRVILPDASSTVLPCKPGESLSTTVQRLLEKREFVYSAFEVISVATGKPLDLNVDVSEMTAREIKVDIRAFLSIELPVACLIVGVRANPNRRIAEVLKPILSQHSLKLDQVQVFDMDTGELVDVKGWSMGQVDGHTIRCVVQEKLKVDPKSLEEITNLYDHAYLDDDQTSTKTSSTNQTTSSNGFHFRGFLRRSSKKYKRKGKPASHLNSYGGGDTVTDASSEIVTGSQDELNIAASSSKIKADVDEENSHPRMQQIKLSEPSVNNSPLQSLLNPEMKLQNSSRHRKPIYITQSAE